MWPTIVMVGLPKTAVKESRERVRSALMGNRLDFPARVITINLSPADLPKEGGCYDLPIALGVLCASGQVPTPKGDAGECEVVGELSLTGELRPVNGILPIACPRAAQAGRCSLNICK